MEVSLLLSYGLTVSYFDLHKTEKRRPNRGEKEGGNTLSNKKCFVDRTVIIKIALQFPDLGDCFTYSKSILMTHKKFSTGF